MLAFASYRFCTLSHPSRIVSHSGNSFFLAFLPSRGICWSLPRCLHSLHGVHTPSSWNSSRPLIFRFYGTSTQSGQNGSTSSQTLYNHYDNLVKAEKLEPQESQLHLIAKLQILSDEIEALYSNKETKSKPSVPMDKTSSSNTYASPSTTKNDISSAGLMGRIFQPFSFFNGISDTPPLEEEEMKVLPFLKGLYIYGGVGQGKTMIMDAFYDTLKIEKKQRSHFHQFMQDIHQVWFC
ncbi:hypothetical protein IE077_003476 [Cardiosporidium cionae]|uniref:Uncharacterized protein n=1 Tax=Cardiosporidium cionae TaxID=476202 RepID=A0ABQ7J879_9APIC|nr:hypothetical protein IE077_003476 [Cardiosporidium cionae]|eukprot:KAF8820173.1 hypothetical protein IE077_003476 [Cardiosporidium cionae]